MKSVDKTWSRSYSLYVLVILMMVYMTSQTDRFVLGIASYQVSHDLRIGHMTCYRNQSYDSDCGSTNCTDYLNKTLCIQDEQCTWDYSATSIYYQILAGPAFIITFALFSIPMGLLATVRNMRRAPFLAFCLLIWSAITCVSGFAQSYWQLLLARVGLGIFVAACVPFAGSIITDYFSEESRGTALGFYSWAVYIGYSIAFACNFIVKSLNWRWVFWIVSIPGAIVGGIVLITIRDPVRLGVVDQEDKPQKVQVSSCFFLKRVLYNYLQLPLLLLCIGAGLRQGGGLVWAYNAKAYFRQVHCDDTSVGTYLSWIPVIGGSVGVFVGGWISDGLVRRWGHKARMLVLIICSFLSAPFLFGTLYSRPPWAFLCLLFAYITGEMWFGVCIAVAIEMVPADISSASLALYLFIVNNIAGNLNIILPPLQKVIGLQHALVVLFPGTYLLSGLLFTIAALVWQCRSWRRVTKPPIQKPLIQRDDEDLTNMLTESQEIQRRLAKRQCYGAVDASVSSVESIKRSLVLTASI